MNIPNSFYLSTMTPVPTEYLFEIQIDAENTANIHQLKNLLMSVSLPYTVSDSTNITEINITTGMIFGSAYNVVLYT